MKPTSLDEAYAKQIGIEVSLDKLNTGYTLYTRKCGGCHLLYKPGEFTEEKWTKTFPEMSKRSSLTKDQGDLVLHYLMVKAKRG